MKTTMRKALVILGLTVLVIAGVEGVLYAVGAVRLGTAEEEMEARFGAERLTELAPPRVPAHENGASLIFGAGAATMVPEGSNVSEILAVGNPAGKWSGEDWTRVEELVAENEAAWGLFLQGVAAERVGFNLDYDQGAAMELPNFLELIRLGKLARARGELALRRGDTVGLEEALRGLRSLVEANYRESTLITALVGFALERQQLQLVRSALARGPDRVDLSILDEILLQISVEEVVKRGFAAEAVLLGNMDPDDRLGGTETSPVRITMLRPFDPLVTAGALDYYESMMAAAGRPLVEIREEVEEGVLRPGPWARLSPMIPDLSNILERAKATAATRQLARVAIELAREADATGDYPKDLRSPPRSPYTGSPLPLTPSRKGGVVLSVPGADELW
ncbi:MAG: hypothetical protein R3234_04985, partial [Thermoanaerobaculia bacterium]|nr:hypothetical protein [Thermoanaerobaculia bacterium]